MEIFSLKGLQTEPLRSKTAFAKHSDMRVLDEIKEEEEWVTTENRETSQTPAPVLKKAFMRKHCRILSDVPTLSSDPTTATYQKFLLFLQKHLLVYDFFISSSVTSNLLQPFNCKPSEYYYKYIHFSNNSKFQQSKSKTAPMRNPKSSGSFHTSSNSSHTYEDPTAFNSDVKARLMYEFRPKVHSTKPPKIRPISRSKRLIQPKRSVLVKARPKLMALFQNMCGMSHSSLKSCRLTNALFKAFLQKKFPIEMVDAIARHFDFKSSNYDEFCVDMDRFICGPEERQFALCFDAFDFNKDKYICYQDTYMAIGVRRDNLYDSDLVKIKKMFEMKKKGMVSQKRESRRGRRMSVMSFSSELTGHDTESHEKRIPYNHPDKPEALTVEDFQRIEFKPKPQLLLNFLKYTCNFDLEKLQEVSTPLYKSRKQSQDIILDNFDNPENADPNDPRADYFSDLEISMNLLPISLTRDLLEKFEILRDKQSPDFKKISKSSMEENWPKLFGVKCDYISQRFFKFFEGPGHMDVTKSRFLRQIHSVNESLLSMKMFAFNIYDDKTDGKITPDEIYRMEQALPEGSLIYDECMLIVNEFIASIFGRKRKPVPFVDFGYFNELIPDSLFYTEFMRFVNTPTEELLATRNPSWVVKDKCK